MTRVICPKCRIDLERGDWSCPRCGTPAEEESRTPGEQEISTKGMLLMLLLFVTFPVLLFLIHILVPGM